MAWLDYDGLLYFWQKIKAKLDGKVDKVTGKQLSTNDYTTGEKNKLAGLSNYTHPTSSGNKHIPAGGSAGQFLKWSADGTAVWANDNNTTYTTMTGATESADGKEGLAPKPAKGQQGLYLRGDGTWATPTNTTYGNATTSADGLMSKEDKTKLDGFEQASTYASKTYVGQQISAAGHIKKSIVETLPEAKDAKDNIIYMVKKVTPDGTNLYDEYMLISGAMEKIGDTKTVIEAITNTEIDTILAS